MDIAFILPQSEQILKCFLEGLKKEVYLCFFSSARWAVCMKATTKAVPDLGQNEQMSWHLQRILLILIHIFWAPGSSRLIFKSTNFCSFLLIRASMILFLLKPVQVVTLAINYSNSDWYNIFEIEKRIIRGSNRASNRVLSLEDSLCIAWTMGLVAQSNNTVYWRELSDLFSTFVWNTAVLFNEAVRYFPIVN